MRLKQVPLLHPMVLAFALPLGLFASDGDAGPDQYICSTQAVLAASALTQGETGSWSVVSGAAVFSPVNSPASIVTGLAVGENILQWTVLLNGSPSSSDQVTLTVYDPAAPPANAGPDITLCLDQPATMMQALPVAYPLLGSWSVISGNATIASVSLAQTYVACPGLGSVVLLWTVYNGPCGETSDQVVITVEDCQTGVHEQGANAAAVLMDPFAQEVRVSGAPPGSKALLVDAVGRVISAAIVDGSGLLALSVADQPAGWYSVRVQDPSGPQLLRFLLAR